MSLLNFGSDLESLKTPLSEQEEVILALMRRVSQLEHEVFTLKQEKARLIWSLEEHD